MRGIINSLITNINIKINIEHMIKAQFPIYLCKEILYNVDMPPDVCKPDTPLIISRQIY